MHFKTKQQTITGNTEVVDINYLQGKVNQLVSTRALAREACISYEDMLVAA